jgi:DNA-binding MarR family transcriptional regulator
MLPLARITPATTDVLAALLAAGDTPVWGLRVVKQTGRPTGSVYPILDRLQRAGWAVSSWDADPDRPGPRRRLYALTPEGATAARSLVDGRSTAYRSAAPRLRRPRPETA